MARVTRKGLNAKIVSMNRMLGMSGTDEEIRLASYNHPHAFSLERAFGGYKLVTKRNDVSTGYRSTGELAEFMCAYTQGWYDRVNYDANNAYHKVPLSDHTT